MHNLNSILENETRKVFWDFEKQTDHLISVRQPDFELVNIKKENLADHRENEKIDKY